jgi:spore germination protein YaaH
MTMELRPRRILAAAGALMALAACAAGARQAAASDASAAAALERWGFTAFWDPRSNASLASHGRTLDVAVTTWIALDSTTGVPAVLHGAAHRPGGPAATMALVTSWHGQRFHPAAVRALAGDAGRLRAGAETVARRAAQLGHRGLVLDFEGHEAADTAALRSVVAAFAAAARAAGLGSVTVAIPATDTIAYAARRLIDAGATRVLPMLYDQHWAGGDPGPVSAPGWARQWLDVRVREVGAERVVAGLPLYGYRWIAPGKGETVTHAEAVAAAARAGSRLTRDSASRTLRASLGQGEVWVTDAGLVERLVAEVRGAGVRRVAFWYVGQEDPAVWAVLRRR